MAEGQERGGVGLAGEVGIVLVIVAALVVVYWGWMSYVLESPSDMPLWVHCVTWTPDRPMGCPDAADVPTEWRSAECADGTRMTMDPDVGRALFFTPDGDLAAIHWLEGDTPDKWFGPRFDAKDCQPVAPDAQTVPPGGASRPPTSAGGAGATEEPGATDAAPTADARATPTR